MVEIECHLCETTFSLPQCVDTDKYDGEVVCPNCRSLLRVKLAKGKLQKREFVKKQNKLLGYAELIRSAEEAMKQRKKEDGEGTKQ